MNISGKDLINKYLKFFESKGHVIIPSASLIPQNDPTVLFNTAGMQPLGPYLMGQTHPLGTRLCDVQKCLRTVDFDNIGDNTHFTFFQMLGNWSLGDYFKKEAISWSYEFLTSKEWLNLPLEKLAFTVYLGSTKAPKDEEASNIWKSLGVSSDRIAYLEKDNFWQVGDVGPCGPSTEMFYWTGESAAPKVFDPDDNRWVEIWNDVFMAYYRDNDKFTPLSKKNVDTGMGLERVTAVLNGKKSAYETDLFIPIISKIEELSGKKYDESTRKAIRIIADHVRSSTFIIGDQNGVVPSNTDRGYILRRLIRRAIKYGKEIGLPNDSISKIARVVVENYSDIYSELKENEIRIYEELSKEEAKFEKTLTQGLKEFERMSKVGNIDSKNAFLLFQSYGFPIEMTEEIAKERGISVDTIGFREEFKKHQELSRAGAEQKFKGGLADNSEMSTKLHTATHLLNEALRKVISPDIKQKGSNITPERLRFDFNYTQKLTEEQIKAVENEVNRVIKQGFDVTMKTMPKAEAEKIGAQQEFGVKYPDLVNVYFIGDYSKEFCGGPHVKNTKDIGTFKIIKEEGVAAGVRRIKAVIQ